MTEVDALIAFCHRDAGSFALIADSVASVDAPDGSGRDVADTDNVVPNLVHRDFRIEITPPFHDQDQAESDINPVAVFNEAMLVSRASQSDCAWAKVSPEDPTKVIVVDVGAETRSIAVVWFLHTVDTVLGVPDTSSICVAVIISPILAHVNAVFTTYVVTINSRSTDATWLWLTVATHKTAPVLSTITGT